MQSNDRELIHQLLEDARTLDYLVGEDRRPTPSVARAVIAPVLRRWICDQTFSWAQKLLRPHIVMFPIHEMKHMISLCEQGMVEHWMSLIALQGMAFSSALPKASHIGADGAPTWMQGVGDAAESMCPAGKFFNQKIFYWRDQFFTRSQILAIHANRLGGVHLNFRRGENEAHIDELTQHFGIEVIDNNHQLMVGDSILEAKVDEVRRSRTYNAFELVAVDTARIFTKGILASGGELRSLIGQ